MMTNGKADLVLKGVRVSCGLDLGVVKRATAP